VRAFLNTHSGEFDWDELVDRTGAAAWLRDAGFGDGTPTAVGEDDRLHLVALRAALQDWAARNRDGADVGPAAERLDELLARGPVRVGLEPGGTVVLRPADDGGRPALAATGALAGTIAAAVLDGSWTRLKTCRECGWGFWDRSRNRSGQWCAMRVCGSRTKARSYRRRQQSAVAN
jgi:predicted RNA-binding Zn ribbon-like protein